MTNQISGNYNEAHNNVQVTSESVKYTTNTEVVRERTRSKHSDKSADSKGTEKEKNERALMEKQIKQAIDDANQRTRFTKKSFEYSVDDKTNRISITVRDQETDEVIREIPSEETLDMVSKIWELAGIIVDEKM